MVEIICQDRPADAFAESQRLLAAVSDPVRWRVIARLAEAGTCCVCQLQPVGGVAPNVLSYHLKVLRNLDLVTTSKRGRWVDYTLAPDAHARLAAALPTADSPAVRAGKLEAAGTTAR